MEARAQQTRLALQIVRDNMLDPEDWIIDSYTISCFFELRECKDVGIWFVGGGACVHVAKILNMWTGINYSGKCHAMQVHVCVQNVMRSEYK